MRVSARELRHEEAPLVIELSGGNGKHFSLRHVRRKRFVIVDSCWIEGIVSALCLIEYRKEIASNQEERIAGGTKAVELGMIAIAPRPPGEDRLCKKGFSPEGYEALLIE